MKHFIRKYTKKRFGSAIEHGQAHEHDHKCWTRRDFLTITGLAAAGTPLAFGKFTASPFSPSPLLLGLNNTDDDRILVLIRLKGGNDGLNTVIQRDNDEYYNIRPNIAIQEPDLWELSNEFGMPNSMLDLQPFWNEGKMKVIHNVGYPGPNFSHFRSSDIWASGSDSDEELTTGWIGRLMEEQLPAYLDVPPVVPPALQIGVQTNLVFRASQANMALAISNPTEFYQIAQSGELYDTNITSNCPTDVELRFLRQTANAAFRYSESIQLAYEAGDNIVDYPQNRLAEQLAIVARLIKGNLGTKVYMVSYGGFDTHATQPERHAELLNYLASSVNAFYADLADVDYDNKVLGMTFSEFGRTIYENGSEGTDHGTGGPVLLFSKDLGNGFVGNPPDLLDPDPYGDPVFDVDFRSVYATILKDWCGVDPTVVNHVIGHQIDPINGLVPSVAPPIGSNGLDALLGHNPDGVTPGNITIKYAIRRRGTVRLQITNQAGHPLRTLFTEFKEPGSYQFSFNPAHYFLSPGEYLYKLSTSGKVYLRPIKIN